VFYLSTGKPEAEKLQESTTLLRNGTRLTARCHFTGPRKVSISRAQPPEAIDAHPGVDKAHPGEMKAHSLSRGGLL
jgi:hypothetical protein